MFLLLDVVNSRVFKIFAARIRWLASRSLNGNANANTIVISNPPNAKLCKTQPPLLTMHGQDNHKSREENLTGFNKHQLHQQ